MIWCDVNARVCAGSRSRSAVKRKFPKTATRSMQIRIVASEREKGGEEKAKPRGCRRLAFRGRFGPPRNAPKI